MFIPKPSIIQVHSLDDTVHLYHLSDFHLKERGCREDILKKHVNIVANDPKGIAILGGDHGSYICNRDKRLDYRSIDSNVSANDLYDWGNYLVNATCNILEPIKHKIILAHRGNHEGKYTKMNQHDVHKMVCDRLGIYNGGYTSILCIRFTDMNEAEDIIVHSTHGSGSSTTSGGIVNKLKKYAAHVANSDLVLVGHMHHQVSIVEKVLYYKNGMHTHYKTCVCPGSYLESYNEDFETYGEEKGYSPPIVGCARIDIIPRTKEIQVQWMK